MPREPFKPLTAEEQRFVLHFIREKAAEENIHIAERKARLKPGDGKQLLRRKHVQQEIHRRMTLIEFEENRLIARDNIGAAQKIDERDLVTLHKIESALDKVLSLDADKHGNTVLKAIELSLIYTGSIRDGNKVKLNTIDPLGQDNGEMKPREEGFYASIFSARAESATSAVAAAPLIPEDEASPSPASNPPAPAPAPPKPSPASKAARKAFEKIEIT